MPAVAGSRSRAETMISVRPPLSSVMLRSASALRRSLEPDRRVVCDGADPLDPLDVDDDVPDEDDVAGGGGGVGREGGALRPGNGDGFGSVFGGADDPPDVPDDDDDPDAGGEL
jgi:hypothetical protein